MYSFFMGARTFTPNLNWWSFFSQERVFRNSDWRVCWNLGAKFGEPILAPPPK